ncbi:CAMK family protein kinase [Histomonas meleagridis]|uniref:CAMK family protein kinase n=1 Tax=Histomonas meleagridis TaxID=135588 RepID=UPI003559D8E6|nr:CAMK family protein kinase [Histomonas meleagridis]KAH0799019.1 CAMK family protein kinase [Histomonas meleagridis]
MKQTPSEEKIGNYKFTRQQKQNPYGLFEYYVARSSGNQLYTAYRFDRRGIEGSPNFKEMENEIETIGSVYHQSIQSYIDTVIRDDDLFLVLELEANPFFSIFDTQNTALDEEHARHIFGELMEAVSYLHSNGIAHGDINPNSIFFNTQRNLKLGYFFRSTRNEDASDYYGTLNYQPPEACDGGSYDAKKADIWACGVLIYTCLAYEMPFQGLDIDNLKHSIFDRPLDYPTFFPTDLVELLKKMLAIDPDDRLTAAEVLKSPWLSNRKRESYRRGYPKFNNTSVGQHYATKIQVRTSYKKTKAKAIIKQYFANFKGTVQGGETLNILIHEPHLTGLKITFQSQAQDLIIIITRLRADSDEFFDTLIQNLLPLLDPKID